LFEVPREPFDAHQLKGLHGFSRLDNLVNIVLRSTDIILVGTLTSPAATAVYVVASRVAQAAGTFVVVLDPVVAPRISRLFSKGERPELERLARHYSYLTTAFSALFFGILFLFGSDIFALFGPEYRSAVGIAAIIAIGAAASAITGPTGMVLLMTGHQKAGLWITVLSTILYLGLLFILVPKYSVAGAAVASSAGVTVRNVLQALWIWRASGLNTTPLSLVFQADRNP
jgi:O-antigen/teichoic acid export membrane protein